MSIRNHKGVPGYQAIPDENLELPSDFEVASPLENAALWYALQEFPGVDESRLEAVTDRMIRAFTTAVQWYKAAGDRTAPPPMSLSFRAFLLTNGYPDDVLNEEELLSAWVAAIDWYEKRGIELC